MWKLRRDRVKLKGRKVKLGGRMWELGGGKVKLRDKKVKLTRKRKFNYKNGSFSHPAKSVKGSIRRGECHHTK